MKSKLTNILVYFLLITWTAVVLFPLFFMVTTSLKQKVDVYLGPKYFPWVDFQPTGKWWWRIFTVERDQLLTPYWNSLVVASLSALFATMLGSMAAYALTRFRFRFGPMRNRDILFWIVSQRMMPPIIVSLALFLMFRVTKLLDTQFALILVYISFNLPLAVWVMSNFLSQIPRSIEEAALVDGASRAQAFFRIVIPMVLPSLSATFLFCFIFAWNEFLFALVLTFSRAQTMPLLIAMQHFQRGPQWWDISALSTLAVLPPIVITLWLQRYFVKGLIPIGK